MEFDPLTNNIKRRKLITQSEALVRQFEEKCGLINTQKKKVDKSDEHTGNEDLNGKNSSEISFTLGQKSVDKQGKLDQKT